MIWYIIAYFLIGAILAGVNDGLSHNKDESLTLALLLIWPGFLAFIPVLIVAGIISLVSFLIKKLT